METLHIDVEVPPIGKIPVFVRRWGSSPKKALLVHGWMDSSRRWQRLAPYLAAQCEVWGLDLPGFGHSPPIPLRHTTLKTYSELLAGLSAHITDGKALHGIMGHSMGGILSLLLLKLSRPAAKRIIACGPPVKGVYYLKPLANRPRFVAGCLRAFQTFRSAVGKLASESGSLDAHGAPELPKDNRIILPDAYADAPAAASLLQQTCSCNLLDELHSLRANQELASIGSESRQMATATLIMRGQYDPYCSRHVSRQLADALGSELHEVPGALHCPFVERPRETYPILKKFLE